MSAAPLPGREPHVVAVPAPGAGDGWWAGAPSAAVDPAGGIALAYRVRRGQEERGGTVVVARSRDGETFETVVELHKDRFGAESLERPALVALPGGGWRLYVSCATPESKHWWVDALDAPDLAGLATAEPDTIWPGDAVTAIKDPVVRVDDDTLWRAWLCCHPLDLPGAEDRMWTAHATSVDGRHWTRYETAVQPHAGTWDARGTRVTAELGDGWLTYDGRATAEENFRERTGLARAFKLDRERMEPVADVRYLDVLTLPEGGHRLYYEAPLPDGSHELRTELHGVQLIGPDFDPYPVRTAKRAASMAVVAGVLAGGGWAFDRFDVLDRIPAWLAGSGLLVAAAFLLLIGSGREIEEDGLDEATGELQTGTNRLWPLGLGVAALIAALALFI